MQKPSHTAKSFSKPALIMHFKDNVAVCLRELKPGEDVVISDDKRDFRLKIIDPVPLGHKVALDSIPSGSAVVKYGEIIGRATKTITQGQHVHVHNITDY